MTINVVLSSILTTNLDEILEVPQENEIGHLLSTSFTTVQICNVRTFSVRSEGSKLLLAVNEKNGMHNRVFTVLLQL